MFGAGSLQDQIAVVTGASSGVGRAVALGLAEYGAGVCLVGRDPGRLAEVARSVEAKGARAECFGADLALEGDIDEVVSGVRRLGDRVDVLVHSAGAIAWGHLASADIAELDRQMAVNVRAPYLLTRGLLPLLRRSRGQVVFVNSTAGLSARANVGQYSASKHALKAIADSFRDEVNPEGIRVLSVFLGRTATPMQAAVHAEEGKVYRPESLIQPEDVAAVICHTLQLPRTAEVTDLTIRPMLKPT